MKSPISILILCLFCFSVLTSSAQVKPIKVQPAFEKGKTSEQKLQIGKDSKNAGPKNDRLTLQSTHLDFNESDLAWKQYKNKFINKLWELNPGWASWEGYHKYDHVLTIPDESNRLLKKKEYQSLLSSLKSIDISSFKAQDLVDYNLIENFLNSSLWYAKEFKSYEWNPSDYNVGSAFDLVINNDKASVNDRLEDVLLKLKKVMYFYTVAKKNLKESPIEHTELAISQVRGSLYVFKESIPDLIEESTWNEGQKDAINADLKSAIRATEGYADWLEKTYLPRLKKDKSSKSFRLSKDIYANKFKYDLGTDLSPNELYQKAIADKNETHIKMYELTEKMWSNYFNEDMPSDNLEAIKTLIGKISEQHTERDQFIPSIKKQLPELEAFVRENDLVYMDPSKPLVVRETPGYMAGVAGASISSPGPYDKGGETYYNVTPLTNYSEEEAESYLREYNDYMLQILNIHEAIPGHYVQLVYSNESPSLIKSILGNGAMIEGWACYTERMMLEEGYGDNAPELWLMYYKWFLRIACNTILDYSIHNLDMTEDEAINLLVNEAFQEDIEASKKWKRAKLTQVQLCSYYNGFREIYDFREDYMSANPSVSLKDFHEKFLSYGSASVSQISKMMYDEVRKN